MKERSTGTPISMVVYNKTQRSADYSEIAGYTDLDMQIIHLMKNMVSGITEAADEALEGKL